MSSYIDNNEEETEEKKEDTFWWSAILGFMSGSFLLAWAIGGDILGAFLGSSFASKDSSSNDDFWD